MVGIPYTARLTIGFIDVVNLYSVDGFVIVIFLSVFGLFVDAFSLVTVTGNLFFVLSDFLFFVLPNVIILGFSVVPEDDDATVDKAVVRVILVDPMGNRVDVVVFKNVRYTVCVVCFVVLAVCFVFVISLVLVVPFVVLVVALWGFSVPKKFVPPIVSCTIPVLVPTAMKDFGDSCSAKMFQLNG